MTKFLIVFFIINIGKVRSQKKEYGTSGIGGGTATLVSTAQIGVLIFKKL